MHFLPESLLPAWFRLAVARRVRLLREAVPEPEPPLSAHSGLPWLLESGWMRVFQALPPAEPRLVLVAQGQLQLVAAQQVRPLREAVPELSPPVVLQPVQRLRVRRQPELRLEPQREQWRQEQQWLERLREQ